MSLYGWFGKALRVNLNTGVFKEEEIEKKLLEDWLGGRGLGTRLIYRSTGRL
jgi:aldehyde:ferredoxin oxidoreductase